MPLSASTSRREIHRRVIDMKAYIRDDGLYDVESHLVDTKPFEFERIGSPSHCPPVVHCMISGSGSPWTAPMSFGAIEASSDDTPYALCKEAESTLQVLVGEQIARGLVVGGEGASARGSELHPSDGNADPPGHHGTAGNPGSPVQGGPPGADRQRAVTDRQLLCL